MADAVGTPVPAWLRVASTDPELVRRGTNALVVFYGIAALAPLSIIGLWFIPNGRLLSALIVLFVLVAVLAILLVHRGQVTLGVSLFFVALVGSCLAFPLVGGDARLTAIYLAVPVAIAGITLGPVGIGVVTVVSLAGGLAVTWAFPPTDPPPSPAEISIAGVTLIVFVLVTAMLGRWAMGRQVDRADAATARAEALTDEVRAANVELEARVQERTLDLQAALAAQEKAVAELAELSRRDALTGLHNRRHADEELPRLVALAERYHHTFALAIADLDHFKQVNDDHSYQVGDDVLREFADLLREGTRAGDLVARYGGEEFLIAMPETSLADALQACERLRRLVEAHDWSHLVPGLRVTVSIGVTDGARRGLGDLIAGAGAALHEAKRSGRNRTVVIDGAAGSAPDVPGLPSTP